MSRRRVLAIGAVILALGLLVGLLLTWETPAPPPPTRLMPRMPEGGAALYAEFCAHCHGRQLDGVGFRRRGSQAEVIHAPRLDGAGEAWMRSDRALFKLIKYGNQKGTMPPFAGLLSDTEIREVIGYVVSQWPERIRERR